MIEFNTEGPLGNTNAAAMTRLRLIGLGQAGIGSLDQVVLYGLDQYDMLVVDTDQQTLEGSVVKTRLALGTELTRGLGCGGDYELAAEVVADSGEKLRDVASGCDCLILSLNFGGATSSLIATALVKEAAKQNVHTVIVGTMPFHFESKRRQAQALRTVQQLRRSADAVLVFGSDRVTELPQASGNVRQGFHVINQVVGHGIEALAQMLTKRGLIQLGFADIRSLYGCLTHKSVVENCWAGWGEIDSPSDVPQLIKNVLASPLISETVWRDADHAIVCLSGGSHLSLAQVQSVMVQLQDQLPETISVATGATIEETCKDRLRMTVLLARTKVPVELEVESGPEPTEMIHDTVPLPDFSEPPMNENEADLENAGESLEAASVVRTQMVKSNDTDKVIPRGVKSRKYIAKQEELQFDANHRGRFEKSIETIYEGENLDQPTFRRRKLQIRL